MSDMTEFEKEFEGDGKIADLVLMVGLPVLTGDPDIDFAVPDRNWAVGGTPPRPDLGPWGDPL